MRAARALAAPLLWCAAFVAAYALLLAVYRPRVEVAPSQWAMNRIKAERYVFAERAPALVIAGSSLSFRLPEYELGPDIGNLAFGGVGPRTGLEVIRRAGHKPHTVLVEVNYALGSVDEELVGAIFMPVLRELRVAAPVFRYEYQPVNVAFHMMRVATRRTGQRDERASVEVFEKLLVLHRKELDTLPEPQVLASMLAGLEEAIAALEAQGVRAAFLVMPVDPSLADLAVPRAVRARLAARFPPSRHQWIEPKGARPFTTGDGLHLVPEDAARVARQIRAELERGKAAAAGMR